MGIMQHDIIQFVSHFEHYGKIMHGCNASFITLIPKIKDHILLGDYRSININLIGCLYKVVLKILASTLKAVVGSVVDEGKSAYIEGRHLLEGPLIINEVFSWAKNTKEKLFMIKTDFEKAFDSSKWGIFRLSDGSNGF